MFATVHIICLILLSTTTEACVDCVRWDFGKSQEEYLTQDVHSAATDVVGTSLIWMYRTLVSPYYFHHCQFFPSCSEYGQEAVRTKGALRGLIMSFERIERCHSFAFLDRYPLVDDPQSDPFSMFVLNFWDMSTVSMRRLDDPRNNSLW